jgi:hypothetical protein
MNVLIAAAALGTVVTAGFVTEQRWPDATTWGIGALKLFALWCLSFLPGWLYVRFLGMRAKALWNEYVLTLHRMGWDRPERLPKTPTGNIYQQKFEAYYGPGGGMRARAGAHSIAQRNGDSSVDNLSVSTESLFPLFLATVVFAVGWAAVLWDTTFLTDPDGIRDVLKYGFLGAYAFVTGMLIRRFFQSDLRPSAYASAVLRIVLVLLLVTVMHQLVRDTSSAMIGFEVAAAFIIGFFPLVGLQLIQRAASKLLGVVVPPLAPEYPLDQLDGLNLWYEARLTEEGVEDLQNLTTMNLVDVILHTRVPPGRLVDWIDQAFLLIHLDPIDRAELKKLQGTPRVDPAAGGDRAAGGAAAWDALRRVGIRTATDLLKVFSVEKQPCGSLPERDFVLPAHLKDHPPLPADQLRLLVSVLGSEPGLAPVWNWQRHGVTVHPAQGDADARVGS